MSIDTILWFYLVSYVLLSLASASYMATVRQHMKYYIGVGHAAFFVLLGFITSGFQIYIGIKLDYWQLIAAPVIAMIIGFASSKGPLEVTQNPTRGPVIHK